MELISSSNLIDYAICPQKLSYQKTDTRITDSVSLRIHVFEELLKYSIVSKATGIYPSLARINRKLNVLWGNLKNEISYQPDLQDLMVIRHRLDKLVTLVESLGEIIIYNYTIPFFVKGKNVECTISGLGLNNQVGIVLVPYSSVIGMSKFSTIPELQANIAYYAVQSMFYKYIKSFQLILYRLETGDVTYLVPKDKEEVVNTTYNLVRGIEEKIFYPRSDVVTCKNCQYNKQCSWSIT